MNPQVAHALFALLTLAIGVALGWVLRGTVDDWKRLEKAAKNTQKHQQSAAAYQRMHDEGMPVSGFADVINGDAVNRPSRRICPLPECKIIAPHSHTEALIQKMRGR